MQEREKRKAAGFTDATNVAELAERIAIVEQKLEATCVDAARVRRQVEPLKQVAHLVEDWADKKREAAEAKAHQVDAERCGLPLLNSLVMPLCDRSLPQVARIEKGPIRRCSAPQSRAGRSQLTEKPDSSPPTLA